MKIDGGSFVDQFKMLKGVNGIEKPSIAPDGLEIHKQQPGVQSFSEMFMQKYEETNDLGIKAEQAIQRSVMGKEENPHEGVIAIQKASVSLSLMMGVKERLERAYQEIMRMPV
jgi:flagellar hook-basal body complex protein FliE